VTLTASFGGIVTSDADGNYALKVTPGTYIPPLTISPMKNGLVFVPSFRAYTNIATSISNQYYIAFTTVAPTVTSQLQPPNFSVSWFGLSGVSYQVYYSTDLLNWVLWNGVIAGTNGPAHVVVPAGNQKVGFFRVGAVY
jgi:hypothetical protein